MENAKLQRPEPFVLLPAKRYKSIFTFRAPEIYWKPSRHGLVNGNLWQVYFQRQSKMYNKLYSL